MRATSPQPRCAGGKTKEAKSGDAVAHLATVADAMYALLVRRADELVGCTENSPEETELAAIVDAIEAYEDKRWPLGKMAGGKG
jgi:hypothetical protein